MSSSPAFLINDLDVHLRPIPEQQWQFLSQAKIASRELYRLRLQAEHAMLVSGFDELVCLDLLKFTPFDYQVHRPDCPASL
jgi:hypothetical protein